MKPNKIKVFILLLFISKSLFSQGVPQFRLNEIPFGKTENEVNSMLTDAQIQYDTTDINVADFCGSDAILPYFKKGLFSYYGGVGTYFSSECSRRITVKYSGWENIESIDLYFVKTFGKTEPYTLFLVHKKMKFQDGNLNTITQSLSSSVSKIVGKQAEIKSSTFYLEDNSTTNSKLAVWNLENKTVFLLAYEFFSIYPSYMYLTTNPDKAPKHPRQLRLF
jgi:hypothetical protein